ncbi:MAG TPA: DUF6677 family protein [Terriglobia bacterium]|nr:DUF6677 family protein [Terriglobia bacterium]
MSNGDLPQAQPGDSAPNANESETPHTEHSPSRPEPVLGGFTAAPEIVTETRAIPMGAAIAISAGAWLIPGLGHLILGRWTRSLLFALCVFSLFFLGLGMEGKLYGWAFDRTPTAQSIPLQALEFFGDAGVGLPYFVATRMGAGEGNLANRSYDYGEKFLWVAGLLNYLIMLDAFDVALGRKP